MNGLVLQLLEAVELEHHPAVPSSAGLRVYEIDNEEGDLRTGAFTTNLVELLAGDAVAARAGVLSLDPVLVPYSAVSFQVSDGAGAGLPPPPERFHDVVLLVDGGALLALLAHRLGFGVRLGDVDPEVFLALP